VNDAAVVGRVLREYHARGIDPAALRRVGGAVQSGMVTYLVNPDGAAPWVVRACRADAPVPIHVSGSPATMQDWLVSRASTLDCLEASDYPAPRVVRTRSGDPVGMDGMWLTLATTFVEGPLIRPTLPQLGMLGAALGRLHALEVAGDGAGRTEGEAAAGPGRGVAAAPGAGVAGVPGRAAGAPGRAAWYPEKAIPATLGRLDAVAALIPDDWQPLYAQFRRTARTVRQSLGALPRGVVHGDAWPGNAVQSGPDTVTLIDWETAGLGLPVLDLGNCLIESLLDAEPLAGARSSAGGQSSGGGPAAWLVEPDEGRVAAVAGGYASRRVLGAAERDLLPEAVRFGACYAGAIHLYQALAEGVSGTSMDARLERLRNRVAVSEAVARLATPHVAGGPETVR
jgi:Ser/Thr protein kinase RdoA (MazF antagonist)